MIEIRIKSYVSYTATRSNTFRVKKKHFVSCSQVKLSRSKLTLIEIEQEAGAHRMTLSILKIFYVVCIFARSVVFVAIFFVSFRHIGVSKEIECNHLQIANSSLD